MKILYHFRTRGTGAEGVHIAGMAGALEALGHNVIFSNPTGVDPAVTAGGSPYLERGSRRFLARLSRKVPSWLFEWMELGYNVPAFFRNGAILRREKCTLIYERHAFFLFSTAMLARWFRIPLVVEVNELPGEERVRAQPVLTPVARWLDRFVFRTAAVIVVVSPFLKRRLEADGIAPGKVLVLPNAIARSDLSLRLDGSEIRRSYGMEQAVVVGFVGWFVAWHRLDRLLDIFAKIATSQSNLKLLLVGEGILRPVLEKRIGELQMADRVVFAGAVAHAQIPVHIAAMDICVVPHSNEYRSPIKLFEYMGQGKAIVAPATEPITAVIRDDENGLLFEPESAEALEEKLARLVGSGELRARLGRRARGDVFDQHTWEKNAERVLAHLGAGGRAL